MDPELSPIMFRVYRGIRTDVAAELNATTNYTSVGNPTGHNAAVAALNQLATDVTAKRSDDGLRTARVALAAA